MRTKVLAIFFISILSLWACSTNHVVNQESEDNFYKIGHELIKQIKQKLIGGPDKKYPGLVISASFLKQKNYTRLEEYFIELIKKEVIKGGIEISPQNLFELRNNKPLSENEGIIIFILNLKLNKILKKAVLYVSLMQDGEIIEENLGLIQLDYYPGSIAQKMSEQSAQASLFPFENNEISYMEPKKKIPLLDKKNKNKTHTISEFKLQFLCKPVGYGRPFSIKNGDILRSNDFYKIKFSPDRHCYVYIFKVDSIGKVFQLFPIKKLDNIMLNHNNPVEKGKDYILPAKDYAFQLSEAKGTERIYFIITDYQDANLESLYESMLTARFLDDPIREYKYQEELKKVFVERRALSGIVRDSEKNISWEDGGDIFTIMEQKLKNIGANSVEILEFHHK